MKKDKTWLQKGKSVEVMSPPQLSRSRARALSLSLYLSVYLSVARWIDRRVSDPFFMSVRILSSAFVSCGVFFRCPPSMRRLLLTHTDTHGCAHQVKWDGEWWQAKIKVIKMERGTDKPDKVLVSYVGGTSEDDEWVHLSSRRLRPPTEAFGDTSRGH